MRFGELSGERITLSLRGEIPILRSGSVIDRVFHEGDDFAAGVRPVFGVGRFQRLHDLVFGERVRAPHRDAAQVRVAHELRRKGGGVGLVFGVEQRTHGS